MANYNLTNQAIEDSFQPLLQIDSGSALRDGTGSLVDNIIVTSSYALTASFAENVVPTDTGSLLTTASFDNGTRNLTFTKGDSSTFSVNIPSESGSVLPSGVVSGSSQIILTDTTGNLGGNRITGSVANATNARYVNVQPNSINSNYFPSFTNGTGLNTTVYIDTTGYTYNPGQNRLTISNVSATSVTASVSVTAPTFFGDLDGNALTATNATYSQNTITTGKNLHSTEITKGTPLYFTGSGTSGNLVGIYPADAGNPSRMPAGGVAGETIAVGAEGVVLLDGYIGNVDTSLFASGDEVFVAVGGGYTNVPPTGSALIQHLGNVEKSAINGSGVIQMMGEARGLPNIQQGYAWVGDSNGVPQAVATSSFAVSVDTGSLVTTSSFNAYTSSNDSKVQSLIDATGSYATTGSNTFIGNQDIEGSVSSTQNQSNTHYNPQIITDNVTIPTGQNGVIIGNATIAGTYTIEGNSEVYAFTKPPLGEYVTTASYQVDSGSFDTRIDSLVSSTSSYATLTTNNFVGNQTITGSLIASGGFEQFGGPTHTLIGRTSIEAPNEQPGGNAILRVSGSTEFFGGPFSVNQSDITKNNIWYLGNDGQVQYRWPNGNFFNMQNGAFQFSTNQGVGMFFDNPGLKIQPLGINENHMIALSSSPGNFPSLNVSQYTGSCAGIIYNQTNDNSTPTKLLVGAKFSSSFDDTLYTDMNFYSSGSANISTLKLRQQDPLPSGQVGDLASSGSALYFHDGTNWRTVNLT